MARKTKRTVQIRARDNLKWEYNEFREFARSLKLFNRHDWNKYLANCGAGKTTFNRFGEELPMFPHMDIVSRFKLVNLLKYDSEDLFGYKANQEEYRKIFNIAPFEEAVEFYKNLGLSTWSEYNQYTLSHKKLPVSSKKVPLIVAKGEYVYINGRNVKTLPPNIPHSPTSVYEKELNELYMKNGSNFLNLIGIPTLNQKRQKIKNTEFDVIHISYEDAKAFLHPLKLRSQTEYKKTMKWTRKFACYNQFGDILPPRPICIPTDPVRHYSRTGEWVSWEDYLNISSGKVARGTEKNLSFEEARDLVRTFNITDRAEWEYYVKTSELYGFYRNTFDEIIPAFPPGIPVSPSTFYAKEWVSWPNFLNKPKEKIYLKPGPKSKYSPEEIAARRKEPKVYMNFQDAKNYALKLRLTNQTEWHEYINITTKYGYYINRFNDILGPKPSSIPKFPWHAYRHDGWVSWSDFLYDDNYRMFSSIYFPKYNSKYSHWTYEQSKEFMHMLKLVSANEAISYCKSARGIPFYNSHGNLCPRRPDDLPINPYSHYTADGSWVSWQDFANIKYVEWVYDDLVEVARRNKIQNKNQWTKFATANSKLKLPIDLESFCRTAGTWLGSDEFFNVTKLSYLPVEEARKFITARRFLKYTDYLEWWDKEQPVYLPRSLQYYRPFGYTPAKMLGKTVEEKLEGISYNCSVFYLSRYLEDPSNLFSISIEHNGKMEAIRTLKKKHQFLIAMFELDDELEFKKIINQYCEKSRTDGELNRYISFNLSQLLFVLRQMFTEDTLISNKFIHNDGDTLIKYNNYRDG